MKKPSAESRSSVDLFIIALLQSGITVLAATAGFTVAPVAQ